MNFKSCIILTVKGRTESWRRELIQLVSMSSVCPSKMGKHAKDDRECDPFGLAFTAGLHLTRDLQFKSIMTDAVIGSVNLLFDDWHV